jgi:pyruvate/2-oxoglutarate dehydrogenase complex dihydrolipoamide acyltransferase (E2) component
MKNGWIWVPVAGVIGLIVGAWGPREELREREKKAAEEKVKAAETSRSGGAFKSFAQMVHIPDEARRPRRRGPKREKPAAAAPSTNAAPEAAEAPAENANHRENPAVEEAPRASAPNDLRARIEEAQEMWATRVDVARAQWKAKLGLSDDAEKAFDDALQDMNEKLYASVSALAERLASEEKMTPELGFRLMGDTSTILAETYDKIGTCIPSERRAEISEMQMIDFIDPAVAEPLIDVQDKLEGFSMRPGAEGK